MASESAARSTGKVNWFNDTKGYGFIAPDEGGDELFVHQSAIVSEGYRSLAVDDLVEFSITQGSDGKTKAVDVTAPGGGPLKKENKSRGGGARRGAGGDGCYKCGDASHFARDCSQKSDGNGADQRGARKDGCYSCGGEGHFARDCTQKPVGNGADQRGARKDGCYNCGGDGHLARDCTQKAVAGNVRSGGVSDRSGGPCYTCGGVGHLARDCATKRPPGKCYHCGGLGHLARDCDRRGSGGGGNSCHRCGEEGHFARQCAVA
ncbi:hypothetical protein CARUB_v10006250mg [Capsella rubella]|uniref:Uncharacterized protein n=1 Tax=Capsella rubella TaxID=81985 RepID=R0F899_9BRAS|nr:cold shock protein 1 [Capsella rubella]EOA17846.1 hypothetical protein CARUB_v10006250mg [Capsella rubella]